VRLARFSRTPMPCRLLLRPDSPSPALIRSPPSVSRTSTSDASEAASSYSHCSANGLTGKWAAGRLNVYVGAAASGSVGGRNASAPPTGPH
jgi:hypothetical protein